MQTLHSSAIFLLCLDSKAEQDTVGSSMPSSIMLLCLDSKAEQDTVGTSYKIASRVLCLDSKAEQDTVCHNAEGERTCFALIQKPSRTQ